MSSQHVLTALAICALQIGLFQVLAIPLPPLLALRRPDIKLAYFCVFLVSTFMLPLLGFLKPYGGAEIPHR